MKKILLCASLFIGFNAFAQEFQWQWAKRGGGTKQSSGESETSYSYDSEQILDIAVDADNNYYFLSFMTQQNTEYAGTPVTVYNSDDQNIGFTDVVLISTDCEGNLRWKQTIGGGERDYAHKLVLDNNGGLYIAANVMNVSGVSPNTYQPPHFSEDNMMSVLADNNGEPQEGYKTAALLKYNTNDGALAWRVMPQGDVTLGLRRANINQIAIDSQGNLHTLIGFLAGTHLNGQITVPETFISNYKYYLVKFDSNGGFVSAQSLSLEGRLIEFYTDFRYDESLNRYYLAGFRNFGGSDPLIDLSFNSTPFTEQGYILAFGPTGNEVWRKEVTSVSTFKDNRFYDLEIDDDSNVYVTGKYYVDLNNPGVSMNGYQFPMDLAGNVMYAMKLNAEGAVQWMCTPSGYTTSTGFFTGSHLGYDLVVNGDEVGVATQVSNEIWGNISINRPANHRSDAAILRLNKNTGVPIAVHDIMAMAGYDDAFTAITADNDGNYIAGGYFYTDLFSGEEDGIPTLNKVLNQTFYTDFFVTKLASGPCGVTGTDDLALDTVTIFPNPSEGMITIVSNESLDSYEVYNMLGQIVQKGTLTGEERTISIQNLPQGTYIANFVSDNGKVLTKKIIKR
ncbi:MAG: hypothetical protein DI539_21325 [Flavobacterium psychrophilum]|nr:MAG: hypothetical protein DI539_21325 [Flavobacterium psychrophilum]